MTTEMPRLTRAEQTQRTREEIRTAAIDLIESKGFDEATIDDIAEAAGVGRRTFFRHFPCKEAVLFSSGIYGTLLEDFSELLVAGTPPMLALIEGIKRDASTTRNPDETTVRRRKLR
ncbi:MAG: TetR family transcriptional regulator, partial [Pseudoclavibacter sp.]